MLNKKGFTLIELLTVVGLIITLSLIGLGFWSPLIRKNQGQALVDQIKMTVDYARQQALNRGHPVYLTPLNNTVDWSTGIQLSELNYRTNQLELLYQWQWDSKQWTVNWHGLNSAEKITLSNNPLTAISNGRFNLINKVTKESISLVLNRLGRVRIS